MYASREMGPARLFFISSITSWYSPARRWVRAYKPIERMAAQRAAALTHRSHGRLGPG
jgi:hypothetical protein